MRSGRLRALRAEASYLRRHGVGPWMMHLYAGERTRTWIFRWFWLTSLAFLMVGAWVTVLHLLGRA